MKVDIFAFTDRDKDELSVIDAVPSARGKWDVTMSVGGNQFTLHMTRDQADRLSRDLQNAVHSIDHG